MGIKIVTQINTTEEKGIFNKTLKRSIVLTDLWPKLWMDGLQFNGNRKNKYETMKWVMSEFGGSILYLDPSIWVNKPDKVKQAEHSFPENKHFGFILDKSGNIDERAMFFRNSKVAASILSQIIESLDKGDSVFKAMRKVVRDNFSSIFFFNSEWLASFGTSNLEFEKPKRRRK